MSPYNICCHFTEALTRVSVDGVSVSLSVSFHSALGDSWLPSFCDLVILCCL